jgi:glycosyltransferase involved in cell wall biosynthesis
MRKLRVLVVGQTPPPFGGQSIMIQKLLEGHYDMVDLYHVRMAFSRNMGEMGRFRFFKIIELLKVIIRIIKSFVRFHPDILLYPPSGNRFWPVLRDIIVLISTRWLFPKTIFVFHAGGLGEFYQNAPFWIKYMMKLAYFNPDAAIHISELSSSDSQIIQARRVFIVPNGLEDVYPNYAGHYPKSNPPVILFVGAIYPSKGIFDLLEACKILKSNGIEFQVRIMGEGSQQVIESINRFLSQNGLKNNVHLIGIKIDQEKWKEFAMADIFCFPTYFEAENLPIVILEAMMFELPVVATEWRAIPTVVREGENGFLVPIKAPVLLAERLQRLLEDAELRRSMGKKGRERFLKDFTEEKFYERMRNVFLSVGEDLINQE